MTSTLADILPLITLTVDTWLIISVPARQLSSVQGIKKMLLFPERYKRKEDFTDLDIQTNIEALAGKGR